MEQTLWDHSRRIVFEHGVTAVRDSEWRCTCADEGAEVPLAAITQTNCLSPVLVELEHPSPDPLALLLPSVQSLLPNTQSRMLDIEIQMHELLPQFTTAGRLSDFLSVIYTAANGVYHCKRMAESYASIVSRFAVRPLIGSDRVIFSDNPEPLFEFDALISAAMRTLDALRRPLWRLYGNPGSVPSSFKRTVDACKRTPKSLKTTIDESWNEYFSHAREHRDCIQHYVSPDAARGYADIQRKPPGFWTMSAWLPDNPEVRSSDKFTYNNRLNALTYAWSLTSRVVQITKTICAASQSTQAASKAMHASGDGRRV